MSRRLSAVVLSVCFIVSITASAQSQGQSATATHGIVLEINIVETTGAQRNEIEKMETGRDQMNRLIAEGKARLFASLQIRTRTGESFSARVGQFRFKRRQCRLFGQLTEMRGNQSNLRRLQT